MTGTVDPVTPAPGPEDTSPSPSTAPSPSPEVTGGPTTPAPATPTPQQTATPGVEPSATPEATPTTVAPTPGPTTAPEPTATATPAVQVPVWPSRPAVTEAHVPWTTLVLAAAVLLVAVVGLVVWWRRTRAQRALPGRAGDGSGAAAASQRAPDLTDTLVLPAVPSSVGGTTTDPLDIAGATADDEVRADPLTARGDATVRFLVRLGEAMVDAGAPIMQVDATVRRVAAVNALPETAVITLPTAVLVSVPQDGRVETAVSTAGTRALRLDQVADVLDLAEAASIGGVRPAEGLERLGAILGSEPASGPWRRAAGYVLMAAGLALVLGGGWLDVAVAAVLGGAVAGVLAGTRRVPGAYQGLLVALCALAVALPVLLLARTGWPVGLLAPLVAPLVTFLPGALLTTAVIDLATRQMIAGSARLAAGVMQLVLLALGITVAAGLVGVPASEVGQESTHALGWAGPWVGVLVYALGVVRFNDARADSLRWIVLVLAVAYAGQVLGGVLFGAVVSSFVGAFVMTPVAVLTAARGHGPPFLVTFLPGFWLLVPGALGLVGVTSALGRSTDRALTTIVTTGVSMVAISLGVLAGLALGGWLQRRFAPDGSRVV